ncbi:hypothetical protein [Streptomyces sp. NPDC050564]|uniref:hypothetical protein n=1 Tax=Streptomyces sp. NPDC050564 TaxID=3365631 RepID=UPI00378F4E1C
MTPPLTALSLPGIQSQQHRIPLLSNPACGFPRRAHLTLRGSPPKGLRQDFTHIDRFSFSQRRKQALPG